MKIGTQNQKFIRFAGAGITFQAGSTIVDSATIISALIYQLTGSPILVGSVPAILRFGWLFPQIFVGYLAQNSNKSMPYYVIGAFGRACCMACLALILFFGANWNTFVLGMFVMVIWTAYSFISGIVAVPYNDIVARSIPSERRSRLLSVRFLGGGILALGGVAIANQISNQLEFPQSFAAIIGMASILMFLSSSLFVSVGEPQEDTPRKSADNFLTYLKKGIEVFRSDRIFREFVYAQWASGVVIMAMPFYIVQAKLSGFDLKQIALLLGFQTTGALVSNALWGWWGDYRGKRSLLQFIACCRIIPPVIILAVSLLPNISENILNYTYVIVFFILGALANGLTIAVIGFLMEISPDDKRPSYSGYFNAIAAPAFLFPLLGGVIGSVTGIWIVFVISAIAALVQAIIINSIRLNSKSW